MISLDKVRSSRGFRPLAVTIVSCVAISIQLWCQAFASEMKFAWPVPSRVTVDEGVVKKGKTAKIRYDMVLSKQKEGENLELHFENFKFLELDGQDVSTPEARAALGPVLGPAFGQVAALQGAMPSLLLTPEGKVVDVVGLDELIDRMLGIVGKEDPKMREALGSVMHSPMMLNQIKQKSKDFWRVWVETWIGAPTAAGKEEVRETDVPFMDNGLQVALTIRNEGAAVGEKGNIQLSAQSVMEGEAATKALAGMMQQIASQVPVKEGVKPFSPDMIKNVKRTMSINVMTNPKTLQPQRARYEVVTELAIGEEKRGQTEKHDYVFDWADKATK